MLDRLASDVTSNEVTSAYGLPFDKFNRPFRAATGVPPHQRLLARRVDRAMELLGQTGMKIADIALHCGFADQSHTTRVFGQHVGMPLGAWLRSRQS